MQQRHTDAPVGINDSEIQRRIYADLAHRSIHGVFVYVVVWLALAIPALDHFEAQKTLISIATYAIIGSALIRLALYQYHLKRMNDSPDGIRWPLYLGVVISGGTWGAFSFLIIINGQYQEIAFAILVCSAGFAAGGTTIMAGSRFISNALLFLNIAPATLALPFTDIPFAHSMAIICLVFMVALFFVTQTLRRQYEHAILDQVQLEHHADSLSLLSTLDPLTQLKNKRFFNEALSYEFKRSQRESSPLSLILVDLDYFKSINDNYGHLAGDECLSHLADLMRAQFNRSTDIIARVGGEEFAILTHNVPSKRLMSLAEQLRKSVDDQPAIVDDKSISLTISIGIGTTSGQSDAQPQDFFKRCDRALYDAKSRGRNQTVSSNIIDIQEQSKLRQITNKPD